MRIAAWASRRRGFTPDQGARKPERWRRSIRSLEPRAILRFQAHEFKDLFLTLQSGGRFQLATCPDKALGMVMRVRRGHPANADTPTSVTTSGIVMERRQQYWEVSFLKPSSKAAQCWNEPSTSTSPMPTKPLSAVPQTIRSAVTSVAIGALPWADRIA